MGDADEAIQSGWEICTQCESSSYCIYYIYLNIIFVFILIIFILYLFFVVESVGDVKGNTEGDNAVLLAGH